MKELSQFFSKIKPHLATKLTAINKLFDNAISNHLSLSLSDKNQVNKANKSKPSLALKDLINSLNNPISRTILACSLLICICVTSSYAQGTIDQTSADITTTIKNLFTQIYDNFRIPISAVALTVAAAKFASSDANGRRQSYLIGGAILLFWIIPGLITFFTDVTRQ